MDTFFEQIISVKKSGKTIAKLIGIWLLCFILCIIIIMFGNVLMPFSLLLLIGVIFGAYKLSTLLNIEYEYIVTNGTMDIDKIVNKGSRKRVLSFELQTVSRLEKFNPAAISSINSKELYVACDYSDPNAYLMVSSREGKGSAFVVFSPDERVKGAILKFIPKFIANSAFK